MKRKKPATTEAEAQTVLSWCVAVTASLVKELESEGHCKPELYESLKGIQLMIDRNTRKLEKSGHENRFKQLLPMPPDIGDFDKTSPPQIIRGQNVIPVKGK